MSTFRDRLYGRSLYLLSRITGSTCRFGISGLENLEAARATGRPLVLVAWHGMTMMMVGFFTDRLDTSRIVLLMPDDWRGGALSVFASLVGADPFPMDLTGSESMATARKLADLVRRVRQGYDCYITPDGPDGPAYVIKPGAVYIAKKARATILPVGAYVRHGYRLNRWDQYAVPYPFSRISIAIGAPMTVSRDREDLDLVVERLTDMLHRVTAQSAANYYEQVH